MKLFNKAFEDATTVKLRKEWDHTQRLYRDFPWLWAITNCCKDGHEIHVSQDLCEVRTQLMCQSDKVNFALWVVSLGYRAVSINQIELVAGKTWAESIMKTYYNGGPDLPFIVSVYKSLRRINIYRHPDKRFFNSLIENEVRLHGLQTSWLVDKEYY